MSAEVVEVVNTIQVVESPAHIIEVLSASMPATRILSGNNPPVFEQGRLGDFYIDLLDATFYGPKSTVGWGVGIALGQPGADGAQGDTGPQGPQGPQGIQGPPGEFNMVHTQDVPALVWTINHNQGFYPSVTVVDTQDEVIECVVDYPTTNTVIVSLSYLTAGRAFLN